MSLFEPNARPHSPYRLTPSQNDLPKNLALINMCEALHWDESKEHRDATEYTTRIIRTYRESAPGKFSYERLDWDLIPAPDRRCWDTPARRNQLCDLVKRETAGSRIDAVVVKDMLKQAVDRDLIEILSEAVGTDAEWYVSSKRWMPDWLPLLRKKKLQLMVVPEVAANEAIQKKQLGSWITKAGTPTKEAIRLVDGVRRASNAHHIVVLPGSLRALLYATRPTAGSDGNCFVQPEAVAEPEVPMGGSSIFFPAMIACLRHRFDPALSIEKKLGIALSAAHDWVTSEAQRVLDPKAWRPDPQSWSKNVTFNALRAAMLANPTNLDSHVGRVRSFDWATERRIWHEASSGAGVVRRDDRRMLHLWRAMVEVDDYINCNTYKQGVLRNLVTGVRAFASSPRHHFSCMMVARPGSGKTYLARQLAKTVGLRFLPFNITQMQSRTDILKCFDTITAAQSADRESRLLVFVDEVNADIDGSSVFGAFLAPLEEGAYVRDGHTFSIEPCAWIFADTTDPRKSQKSGKDSPAKGSDFVSRLTLPILNFTSGVSERDYSMENVYLGVALLRSEFSDVTQISEPVLSAFRLLPKKARPRDIKHFVERFQNIQAGKVTSVNVPRAAWPGDPKGKIQQRWQAELKRATQREQLIDIELNEDSGIVSM